MSFIKLMNSQIFKIQSCLWFQQAQNTANELGSKETFLKTWNFLLNNNGTLNLLALPVFSVVLHYKPFHYLTANF